MWCANKYWHTIRNNHWTFATKREDSYFTLCEGAETPIVRHLKVEGEASPYDGNLAYWSARMGHHPEVKPSTARLLKRQKGKCAHCGLIFKPGDLWEIDHIQPKANGGVNGYDNLQRLHKHCHDLKTCYDKFGTHVKSPATEEPDDAKVSRPVLKTNGSRKGVV